MLTHYTPLPPLHALHPLPSSLGWRPQNASFHTDKQYLRNHPDAVFDAAANGTYGELKGGYYRFPKPLKHMVDHPTSCFPCPPGSAQVSGEVANRVLARLQPLQRLSPLTFSL